MKSAFAAAGILTFFAGSAYAQPALTPETCREELLAHLSQQGIEPTGIQAGSSVTIRGHTFVVPLRATPDTLCLTAIEEFALERERENEVTAATARAETAEDTADDERKRAETYFGQLMVLLGLTAVTLPITVLFFVLIFLGWIRKRKTEGEIPHYARRRSRIKGR